MGYITNYYGEIFLSNKKVIKIIKRLLKNGEYPFEYSLNGEFSIVPNDKNTYLSISCNWKDYNDEMLKLCSFISFLDKNCQGNIECSGEEKDDIWKIIIENGKVKRVNGFIEYDYENPEIFEDSEAKKEAYKITKDKQLLKELMIENLK